MGFSLSDAQSMSLWTYEAALSVWNDRHRTDDDDDVEAPDWEMVSAGLASVPKAYLN